MQLPLVPLSRRALLAMAAAVITNPLSGQGVVSRRVQAQPRGKASGLPFASRLTDVAAQAGLRFPTIYGPEDHKDYILETVGCGCAFFDYDNDGWMDVLVLCGTRLAGDPPEATNRLYKNNRDGTFTDVTRKAGLWKAGWASAVCVGDYNNDGFEDLFITYYGQNVLYRNNGDGTFTDVTAQAGLLTPRPHWGAGCSFFDYDRDGRLDLFVSTYVDLDLKTAARPGDNINCTYKGLPVNCGPRGLATGRNFLFHNNGDGTFTDVTERSGISKATAGYGMTVVTADLDDDGWPDIYVASDSTPSLFFRNKHDGTFSEEGLERGIALSEDGMEQAGMGVGVGDFNLDGRIDLFKTHFADDTNILYRNEGKGSFNDVTLSSGLGVETRYTGWGAGLVDLDNDGLPDLFFVTGSVYPELSAKLPDYPYQTPRVVFRNLGAGKFEELIDQAGPGVSAVHASRGCAFGDFDNDGDLDILIINLNEPPSLLRNDVTKGGHWLKVKLVGTTSNRSALGAKVTCRYGARMQAQQRLSQSSFYSSSDPRLHFGLGPETTADLEIRWPNGALQTIKGVKADQLVTVVEGRQVTQAALPSLRSTAPPKRKESK